VEPRFARSLALAALVLSSTTVAAQQTTVRGHVKGQEQYLRASADSLTSSLGYGRTTETDFDLRVIGALHVGRFGFDADYSLQVASGAARELQRELEALEPELFIDRAKIQWLPLDDTLTDDGRTRAQQRFDRFSVAYTTESWVFKLGRQAYSWGNGIVFRPFDIFDPFAPDVIDDSYKPGIDSVYMQRLFADGSDLAALVVPRRDAVTGELSSSASSAAIKWRRSGPQLQTDWLVARDYADTVAGVGIAGSLGEAVWRVDIVPVWLDTGGSRTSLVANFEHAWQWRSRNVDGFVEYFRNGFGRRDRDYALDALEPEIVVRLARGQLFNTGRDYLSGGLRVEVAPLVEIDPVLLLNLRDRSALVLVRGSYSLAQNVSIDFGLRAGIGPPRTEFGGLPTSAGSGYLLAPPARAYVRFAYYF
jgi:hypothetical protein